jgi:NAD(P)-dependent dehydrogenase (short-subunit alcohol dehydrogenase family)
VVFRDKTVVVTGAGSGIGRALAEGFCADGANVVGIGRTADTLEETARRCGAKMTFVVGDIADRLAVDALFSEVHRRLGRVDILVNNAALYPKKPFLDPDFDSWIEAIETNVIGMALCCRAALPAMLERGSGRILNVGSFAWKGPIPLASAYSVSKAAVHALTRSIAVEIDRDRYPDVLVNEFLPGIVRTAMSDAGISPADVYPHAKAVACLPRGGPSGQTFLQSALYEEHGGRFGRVRRLLNRVKGTFGRAS